MVGTRDRVEGVPLRHRSCAEWATKPALPRAGASHGRCWVSWLTAATPPTEEATVIRSELPTDGSVVDALIRAAFGQEEGPAVAELWNRLRVGEDFWAGLLAVTDGDVVVGHVGLSRAWLDARRALVEVALLSPLSVHPEHQRLGLGAQLVAAAVGVARERGVPFVVLEGDPGYYGRCGFRPVADFGIEPVSSRVPAGAAQAVDLSAEPWMTGRLVYPDLWWRLDAVGLRDPLLSELERNLGASHP